jgi:hypothetical protein
MIHNPHSKMFSFTVEVNLDELTETYLEATQAHQPDTSLESMILHECLWIEGSGLYVRTITEIIE